MKRKAKKLKFPIARRVFFSLSLSIDIEWKWNTHPTGSWHSFSLSSYLIINVKSHLEIIFLKTKLSLHDVSSSMAVTCNVWITTTIIKTTFCLWCSPSFDELSLEYDFMWFHLAKKLSASVVSVFFIARNKYRVSVKNPF